MPPNLALPVAVNMHSLLHVAKDFVSVTLLQAEKPHGLWPGACAIPLASFLPSSVPVLVPVYPLWDKDGEPEGFKTLVHCGFMEWHSDGHGLNLCFLPWVGGDRTIPKY